MADRQGKASLPQRRERQDALEHRQQILAAAKRLFAAQGIEGTSMCEIARAAGAGQGTLYRHFADKGELCQALIQEDLDAFMARVDASIDGACAPASALARLDALMAEKVRLVEQHLPLIAAIEGGAPRPRRPGARPSPWYAWLRAHVARLLAEAVARGEVVGLDVEFTADAIMAVLAPPLISYQRQERSYSLERIVAGARRLFVEGLRPGPA